MGGRGSQPGPRDAPNAHLNSAHWTATDSGNRNGKTSPCGDQSGSNFPPDRPYSANMPESPRRPNRDDWAASDDRVPELGNGGRDRPAESETSSQTMPAPNRDQEPSTPANKGGKFSFTLKPKVTPTTGPKPVPDLAQRMQVRGPPPRAPAAEPPTPRNRLTNGPMPTYKPEPRFDRRDRGRDRGRDKGREPRDRRDFWDQREPRDTHGDFRDRWEDRRAENRRDRRKNDRRSDFRDDRRAKAMSEPQREAELKPRRILTRFKPRPTISDEFAQADSVYYRKPGNESVIGAGTYGKVFKGIHVYTQRKVALKKIRMEGEKDGFPVTAVREIKLLQHLRNDNVVSLLEVMVERNECFMVFEYLSHDLTGLINHPTFCLTLPHKKNLAKQMFEGLRYLHHRGVLHRDIKAANILISNTGLLKYADFGLARFFSKSRQVDYTNRVITIWYRPPELLLGETRYGPSVDVWSAACVCMEMFTKKAVFPGEGSELSQLDKIYQCLGTPTRAEWPDLVEMPWFQLMRPTERKKRVFEDLYRETLTPAALEMVTSVFQYDPSKRPTADEVLQHPFFTCESPSPQQAIE
ncbi:CTD kinase subunit alpha [Penicillium diatomitis]|uniref:cyclin-dependent kinase n=1 Tax=Penicillium diatomitis TaxID=2819901 RepID=A0A9X0C2Q1_9EURO|nr:CTD kinase subunit alpha [Penicillium diatomitis]KAJ5495294.1 CTD kinase subunit alpha [Penicillium diatomitis]